MTEDKRVKVTLCPPAPQTVFFQETQFDESLTEGADPIKYEVGRDGHSDTGSQEQLARNANIGLAKSKKKKLKKAEQELEGHENKEEIMKILRSE